MDMQVKIAYFRQLNAEFDMALFRVTNLYHII